MSGIQMNDAKLNILSKRKYIMTKIRSGDLAAVGKFDFMDIGSVDAYIDDWTPLTAAIHYKQEKIAEYLIQELAANVQKANKNGLYPIHYAAYHGFTNILRLCLNIPNASPTVTTISGDAPIHYAAQNGHLNIFKILLAHRADVNQKNCRGKTALDILDKNAKIDKLTQTNCILCLHKAVLSKKINKNQGTHTIKNISSKGYDALPKFARTKQSARKTVLAKLTKSRKLNTVAPLPKQFEEMKKKKQQKNTPSILNHKSKGALEAAVLTILSANPNGTTSKQLFATLQKRFPSSIRKELLNECKPIVRKLGVQITQDYLNHKNIKVWVLRKNQNTPEVEKIVPQHLEETKMQTNLVKQVKSRQNSKINSPPKIEPITTAARIDSTDVIVDVETKQPKEIEKKAIVHSVLPPRIQTITKEAIHASQSQSEDDDGIITFGTNHKNQKGRNDQKPIVPEVETPRSVTVSQSIPSQNQSRKRKRKKSKDKITKETGKKMRVSECGCWGCVEFGLKAYSNHMEGKYGPVMKAC